VKLKLRVLLRGPPRAGTGSSETIFSGPPQERTDMEKSRVRAGIAGYHFGFESFRHVRMIY
jgi:hypothetical protein